VRGSSFELTLRHGRRSVTVGWWLGDPSWPILQLGIALERLAMWPFYALRALEAGR
jgi:hypothetical protein